MRPARLIPFALIAFSVAACGNGHDRRAASSNTVATDLSPSTSAAAGVAGGAASITTSTTKAGSTGGASQSPATAAPAVTNATAKTPVTPAVTSLPPVDTAVSTPESAATATPKAAAPGTYQERQTGSFTAVGKTTTMPPQGMLVIDAAQPNGTQVWHRYVQQGQSPNDTTMQFDSRRVFLVSTTEQSPQGNVTCTFSPAVPAPPWPTSVGETFSSKGDCGQFTVSLSGRITGQRTVVLGGTSYATWVIDTSLTFSGQVTGSGTQEDWYSPGLRIPLHENSSMHGSYGPFSFSSQLSSDVTSIP